MRNFIFLCMMVSLGMSACTHELNPGQIKQGPKLIQDAVLTGSVDLAPNVKMEGTGTLFIIARKSNQVGGPPLAVKRMDDPVLPIGFQLSQANLMITSNVFEGELSVAAKWSQSGQPLDSTEGDLETSAPLIVDCNAKEIQLILDKVVE